MLPKVLVTSCIRYRPDAPEVLEEFLTALGELDWPADRLAYWFEVDGCGGYPEVCRPLDALKWPYHCRHLFGTKDSRELGGPRSTGETQENLAYLRGKCFRAFEESDAALCLMVDSDIVLSPGALDRLWHHGGTLWTDQPDRCTVSLQVDNRAAEYHEPQSNGGVYGAEHLPAGYLEGQIARAPWAEDGSAIEVARAGACTLYPRAALAYRFHWEPGYRDEQDMIFDRMRADGWRHYLIRDPSLADHRMKRLTNDPDDRARQKAVNQAERERLGIE